MKRLVAEDAKYNTRNVVMDGPVDTNDAEAQQHDEYAPDRGSDDDETDDEGQDDESLDALEDRFHGLEEEVATLVADVHDLALYTKLNITGFMKILKVCRPMT